MRKLSLIISLLIALVLLSACATPMTVTPTAFVETTPTSKPTSIPPIATIEPSPTVDPNMPVDATGKDAQGNWIKPLLDASRIQVIAENGQPVNETWLTFPSGPNGEVMTGWFKNGTPDGRIPTVEAVGLIKKAGLFINVMVKDDIDAKYLHHPPTPAGQSGLSFAGNSQAVLESRYFEKPYSQISYAESLDYLTNILPDNFKISVTDAQGNPHTIYGDEKFTIVLVDPSDIPSSDFIPIRPNQSTILSFTTFDDTAHSVTILVANTIPIDQLSDEDFMRVIFNPYGHVLVFPDLNPKLWWQEQGMVDEATSFAYMALKGTPSYFTLSDSP